MQFVLDASVALRWLIPSAIAEDQEYAQIVLDSMEQSSATVPSLWYLEIANVVLKSIQRQDTTVDKVERYKLLLEGLMIETDHLAVDHAFGRIMTLADNYGLSGYDAAYLELAERLDIPLASLDKKLRQAVRMSAIEVYLPTKVS